MFEQHKPFDRPFDRAIGRAQTRDRARARSQARPDSEPLVGTIDEAPAGSSPATSALALRTGEALRAIEWHELTARLNAARDLRREIRKDSLLCGGTVGASFGDAAARYFKGLGHDEPPVNPDALEARKGSGISLSPPEKPAARGDAREHDD